MGLGYSSSNGNSQSVRTIECDGSAGKNLSQECNKWVDAVASWIGQHGIAELMQRLGFKFRETPTVNFFVLGRYHAHFGGFSRDERAA
jgi:hypothetical protein